MADATLDKSQVGLGVRQFHIGVAPGEVSTIALLPGDPFRVPLIAEHLTDVREVAHKREHRTMVGSFQGREVTATSTGMGCPSTAIAVVHRSDGSGTTFNFTNYLNKVSPAWKDKVGSDASVEWPVGIGAKGNEGVANNVVQTKGSIGYVEYAYAKQNKLTYANMINKEGKTVAPELKSFQAAAANADWASVPGFGVILTEQPGAGSWPKSMIVVGPTMARTAGSSAFAVAIVRPSERSDSISNE